MDEERAHLQRLMLQRLSRRRFLMVTGSLAGLVAVGSVPAGDAAAAPSREKPDKEREEEQGRAWIAGDHHIHSKYSVGFDTSTTPPTPILGGGAIYPIALNATKARQYGLT